MRGVSLNLPSTGRSGEQAGPSDLPSWTQLEGLAAEYGDGFWLLDLDHVQENVRRFIDAFAGAGWSDTAVAWSYKTLWLPPAVRAATGAGALSEVVSRHEYELALAIGIPPTSIIFNGPLKTPQDLARACSSGSQVQLDGLDEVDDLLVLARGNPEQRFRVGLRANIAIGSGVRGRFGFDASAGDLQLAHRTLTAEPGITVEGLHVHISGARQAIAFTSRIEALIDLADELWPHDDHPAYLNVGGGFSGSVPEALARQLPSPPASPRDYAEAIVPALRRRWPAGGPRLIVEPGMALAADVMRFAGRVGATKSIDGVRHAIVSASVHTVKPTFHRMNMPFSVVRADGRETSDGSTVVSGWSCMEDDILSTSTARLERGDWLVFENCGAYTFVLNPRFIRGTPAVLARAGGSQWRTVRPADSVEDWLAPFEAR